MRVLNGILIFSIGIIAAVGRPLSGPEPLPSSFIGTVVAAVSCPSGGGSGGSGSGSCGGAGSGGGSNEGSSDGDFPASSCAKPW